MMLEMERTAKSRVKNCKCGWGDGQNLQAHSLSLSPQNKSAFICLMYGLFLQSKYTTLHTKYERGTWSYAKKTGNE